MRYSLYFPSDIFLFALPLLSFLISKVKSASIVKLGNVVIFRRKYADAVIKKHVFVLSLHHDHDLPFLFSLAISYLYTFL